MARVQIIKEESVKILKNVMLENVERLDAECLVYEAEAEQETKHRGNQSVIDSKNLRYRDCCRERQIYHDCLCLIQRNITEIGI